MNGSIIGAVQALDKLKQNIIHIADSTELSPSLEAASCAAAKEIPSILWNCSFITAFTRALHWSLS
jgi:hypothetical protein